MEENILNSNSNMKRLFIIIGFIILTSCNAEKEHSGENALKHAVAPDSLSVRLELSVLQKIHGTSTIGIVIHNPERVPIQSIRSWVQFDPSTTRIRDLGIVESRFGLFAPGERSIDQHEGFVMLGAAAQRPITDEKILFATFTVRTDGDSAGLNFYDWREGGDGHTAVLSLQEDSVVNIVRLPSALSL